MSDNSRPHPSRNARSRVGDSTPTILAKRENFPSEQSERLHKRPEGASSQARLLRDFGEDVKKSLRLLSEELLRLPHSGKAQKA